MPKKIRPRFSLLTTLSFEEIQNKFEHFPNKSKNVHYKFIQNKIFLQISKDLQHYWSPELVVSIYKEEDGTKLNGLIGPQQTVWAFFLFLYGFTFLLGFFIGIYSLILWSLGDITLWLLSIPISFTLLGIIYLAARFGQKKGHDQTITLIDFMKTVIGESDLKKVDQLKI